MSHEGATPQERQVLGELVLAFFGAFGQSLHEAAEAGGYTIPQARLLDVLQPEQPMPMSEVARALHCDTSNATGLVDRLEQRGLIERRASPTDRRVRAVALTEAGQVEREALGRRMRGENPVVTALDRQTVLGLTRHLAAALEATDPDRR